MIIEVLAVGAVVTGLVLPRVVKHVKREITLYIEEKVATAYQRGRTEALTEVEDIREEKSVDYRSAARAVQLECAACGRMCLHCKRLGPPGK